MSARRPGAVEITGSTMPPCGRHVVHHGHEFGLTRSDGERSYCAGVLDTPDRRIAEALERVADALELMGDSPALHAVARAVGSVLT